MYTYSSPGLTQFVSVTPTEWGGFGEGYNRKQVWKWCFVTFGVGDVEKLMPGGLECESSSVVGAILRTFQPGRPRGPRGGFRGCAIWRKRLRKALRIFSPGEFGHRRFFPIV